MVLLLLLLLRTSRKRKHRLSDEICLGSGNVRAEKFLKKEID